MIIGRVEKIAALRVIPKHAGDQKAAIPFAYAIQRSQRVSPCQQKTENKTGIIVSAHEPKKVKSEFS